ncbi:PREDICTED: putative defensin-like protein 137 [Camelina sativa]|uniref:Defensin-like protein 137 n=1 Tax=Camelina sativa TaxID=90675 RepID=A0ABM1Q8Q1_CAMSA|nr:PREDICTED: putative defensin-like protein 137 [Camelina sativa]
MKRNFQLSFVTLIIFTVLMLGVMGDMSIGGKRCWATLDLKDKKCVYEECKSMCLKKNPKGHGACLKSFGGKINCLCGYNCR